MPALLRTALRAVLLTVGLAGLSCLDEDFGSECGNGTVERNGICEVRDPPLTCGQGTVAREGRCVPEIEPMVCGPGTIARDGECVLENPPITCGEGTMLESGMCVPIESMEVVGIEGLIAHACRANRCSASGVVDYWNRRARQIDGTDWDDHAQQRTVTFIEIGARMGPTVPEFDELIFRVTDGEGGSWDCKDGAPCPGLQLEAGRPVNLAVIQAAGNLSSHFLAAPKFFRTVAWRDTSSVFAKYRSAAFDAIGAKRGTTTSSVVMSFVPMTTGTFDGYCHLGVADGGRFADIAGGTVTPNFGTGHAGYGMYAGVSIVDPSGMLGSMTLTQDQLPDRDPAFDRDARANTPFWTNPAVHMGKCCIPLEIEMADPSETDFYYQLEGMKLDESNPLTLVTERGYQLTFRNTSTTRNHRFVAPTLLQGSVMRRAEDTVADVRAARLTELEVEEQQSATLSIVPLVAARFHSYCSVGGRTGTNGVFDLGTGHSGSGMNAPIRVVTSTTN